MNIQLYQGDCLELMKNIPDGSVDMVLADPPYGTMDGGYKFPGKKDFDKWDVEIPGEKLFPLLACVARPNGKILLFCNEPYTSKVVLECNPLTFSQRLAWKKNSSSAFLGARKKCLQYIEDIVVLKRNAPAYDEDKENPLREYFLAELEKTGLTVSDINRIIGTNAMAGHYFTKGAQFVIPSKKHYETIQRETGFFAVNYDRIKAIFDEFQKNVIQKKHERYPAVFNLPDGAKSKSNVFEYAKDNNGFHPTQKPVLLLEDLIRTYSNPGDTILDFTMGSGSTGVAAVKTGRSFIGMELDPGYFETARKRIADAERRAAE